MTSIFCLRNFIVLILLGWAGLSSVAQTWSPPTGGSWTNIANWNPAIIPNGSTASAVVNQSFISAPTFTLDTNIIVINRFSYKDTSSAFFGGTLSSGTPAGILIFGGLNPTVDAPADPDNASDLVISCPVIMTNGLTKTGGRTVIFNGTSFTGNGTLTISNGTLVFSGPLLPAFTNGIIYSGGTLEPYSSTATETKFPLTISGNGATNDVGDPLNATAGALWFRNPTATITWPGAITLAGGATIGSFGSTCREVFTGGISGTGSLLLTGGGAGPTSQTGIMTISNTACTYSGDTTIQNNTKLAYFMVRLALNNALPTNTVLNLSLADNTPATGVILDLYGNNQTLAGLNNDFQGYLSKYLVINSSATYATLTLKTSAPNTFNGLIGTNGDNLNLVVQGSTLTLGGANQYGGSTTVSSGELVGVNGGSCANSAITVAAGATLGVQVLTNGGQWSCHGLTLNSGSTTTEFDLYVPPSSTIAPLLVNGNVINNGRLNVTVLGAGFADGGRYPLIKYTGTLTVGTLGTIALVNGGTAILTNNTGNKSIDMVVSFNNAQTIQVEAAPDGTAGMAVPAQTVPIGGSITNYAILRNHGGAFVSNCPAFWVLTNLVGGVNSGDLVVSPDTMSAVFTGHGAGAAQIVAVGNTTNLVSSGVITVANHATVGMRLQSGSGGENDFLNSPNSFPMTKAGTTYMYFNGTIPVASNHLFNTSQAMIVFECTSNTTPNDFFTGTNDVVPAIQQFENNGWNVYGVWVLREDWLTGMIPQGKYGAYDWRILSTNEISNIRNAIATSTLRCKNSVKLIQLLGSGAATALGETNGHAANFPTFPPNILQVLQLFDGVGLECHVGYETQAPAVLAAMADIAQWCASNNLITFQFMGGGASSYTDLPATQVTYEKLWSEMLTNGVNYRSNNIIYFRQGGRAGQMVPESDPATLTHQQAWLINALANGSLTVSDIPDQSINSSVMSVVPFTVSEIENPASSISVSAASSDQSVLANSSLVLSGRGTDRLLTITPNPSQSGVTTVSLIATDGTMTTTNSFQLTLTLFHAINDMAGGPINTNTTWGVSIPVAGDTNTWRTGASAINMTQAGIDTFYGDTFEVQTNGQFAPGVPTATLTLNKLILSGGTITTANNNGVTLDLSGDQCTLNSGTLKAGSLNSGCSVIIQDGYLAGSGNINITCAGANGGEVQFTSTINTMGFIGSFNVATNGLMELPPIVADDASFGLNLSGTGLYKNDANVALTSLVIAGTNIPPGIYAYTNFTPAQQAFIGNNGGVITVVSTNNTPPVLVPVANQTLIAGQTLTITNVATDTNVPAQTLTFSLLNPPAGTVINPSSGIFTWRPAVAQSPSTNLIRVVVADSGSPTLSATNSFNVTVSQPAKPVISAFGFTNGQFNFTVNGTNGPDYIVLASTNLTSWVPLWTNYSPLLPFSYTNSTTNFSQRFYRVLMGP